jgi:hypothetical protein
VSCIATTCSQRDLRLPPSLLQALKELAGRQTDACMLLAASEARVAALRDLKAIVTPLFDSARYITPTTSWSEAPALHSYALQD